MFLLPDSPDKSLCIVSIGSRNDSFCRGAQLSIGTPYCSIIKTHNQLTFSTSLFQHGCARSISTLNFAKYYVLAPRPFTVSFDAKRQKVPNRWCPKGYTNYEDGETGADTTREWEEKCARLEAEDDARQAAARAQLTSSTNPPVSQAPVPTPQVCAPDIRFIPDVLIVAQIVPSFEICDPTKPVSCSRGHVVSTRF